LTDAGALKALAHPARQLMLAKMRLDGPVTATEVSELVGLSPSACSWHLRALAKTGFVAKTTGPDARETRWQAVSWSLSLGPAYSEDLAYQAAARLLIEQYLEHTVGIHRAWADREDRDDPAWKRAAEHSDDVVWLTPKELKALMAGWIEQLRAYRQTAPANRPDRSRQVSAALMAVPFELEWLAEQMHRL
jgi:DNA-binding transcriptional ArsR family regulator